ncbi:hypothetical protein PM082_011347 [Marasmius tenuissimus]|nr:hypothetical protein PM082_011347 [Marasmius tenuissimus]
MTKVEKPEKLALQNVTNSLPLTSTIGGSVYPRAASAENGVIDRSPSDAGTVPYLILIISTRWSTVVAALIPTSAVITFRDCQTSRSPTSRALGSQRPEDGLCSQA